MHNRFLGGLLEKLVCKIETRGAFISLYTYFQNLLILALICNFEQFNFPILKSQI